MHSNIIRVAAYLRFSSNEQRMESLDAQLRAVEEYCKSYNYEIVRIYSDKAKSATSDKRPEFQRMIKDSEQGLFDMVIVHKLDRFARNKYDSAVYKKKLRDNNIRIVSVTERLDDSPESVILEGLIESMSEFYSLNLAREVMKGKLENSYKAMHNGGLAPLGYDVDENKKYVINEKEAEAVKLIFQMYLDNYTSGEMIKKLNSLGFRTKKGSEWTKNSITSIVRNEKYTGVYIYNRSAKKDPRGHRNNHKNKTNTEIVRIDGGMPAVIDKEIFERVQEKLKERKNSVTVTTKTTYLLAGIVKCSCGSAMHGNRRRAKRITSLGLKEKPEYVSYRCGCRKNKSSMVCDNPEIRKEYLEEYVLTELEKIVLNDNVIDELSKKVNEYLSEEEKNIIRIKETFQKELTEIDGRIKNIINAVSMGFASVDLKNELDRLNLKKNELETNLSKLNVEEKKEERITTEDVKIRLKNIKSFILERDYPEIRKFIKDFVKKIVVSKEGIEVTFNPLSSFVGYISEVEMYSYINRKELYEPLKRSMSLKIKKAI